MVKTFLSFGFLGIAIYLLFMRSSGFVIQTHREEDFESILRRITNPIPLAFRL